MANPRRSKGAVPKALGRFGGAYTAGSLAHPDMRGWYPDSGSADADLLPQHGTIRARSRDLLRNHGVAEGAIQTLTDNIVGSGLRLKSRPVAEALNWTDEQAETWSDLVEARWKAYAESTWCDAARSLTFHGLTKLAYGSSFMNGEAVALPLWLDRPGAAAKTCLQMVEADRLVNPNGQPDRRDLRGGIEIDEYGAPLAYWIRKSHPGDVFWNSGSFFPTNSERIPAYTPWGRARVIHLHDKERVGQSRGKPQLASVMRQFKVLGDYTNAELKAAVVNAMVAIVTKSSVSQEQLVELLSSNPDALKRYQDGLADRKRASIDFNAGMILPLALGEDFASFSPGRPTDAFEPFVLSLFRHIAAGLNLPYELLLKDFSKSNYSSARAALLEAWRFFRGRRKWLVSHWCQPIFELWLEEEVMEGNIEAPDFYAKRAFYCATKWIGDGRGWIDPLKEAQATEARLRNGISTLENECAEQGEDWEELMKQRSREEKRAQELGVMYPWMSGADTVTERVNVQDAGATDPEIDPETGQEKTTQQPSQTTRAIPHRAADASVERILTAAAASLAAATESSSRVAQASAEALRAIAERPPTAIQLTLPGTHIEVPITVPAHKVTKTVHTTRDAEGNVHATVVEESSK